VNEARQDDQRQGLKGHGGSAVQQDKAMAALQVRRGQ